MGEFRGTEQIISAKQNQNIKEALTGASSILNIWRENRAIVLKPKQEMAIYSLLQRRDVMEILSTRFGKNMIFTVFAMAKEEISSSKTCMITISPLKVLSTTRYLKCCRWAVKQWTLWQKQYITRCYRITHSSAIHRTVSAIVVDESHTAEERRSA